MSGKNDEEMEHSNKFTIEDLEEILNLPASTFTEGTDTLSQVNTDYQHYDEGSLESLWNDQTIENLGCGSNYDFNNTQMGNGTMNQLPESSHESYKREKREKREFFFQV